MRSKDSSYTFVSNKVTFATANAALHSFPCQLLGLFWGLRQDLCHGNQAGSYKKKGLKPTELHPVLSWTVEGGICGLTAVCLCSVTTLV